jgi:hypothetical protein
MVTGAAVATQPAKPEPEFTRRSGTESICMHCFITIRVKAPELLANEEREHLAICLQRPDARYPKQ